MYVGEGYVHTNTDTLRDQQKVSKPLSLELQVIITPVLCRSSTEFYPCAVSPDSTSYFYKEIC